MPAGRGIAVGARRVRTIQGLGGSNSARVFHTSMSLIMMTANRLFTDFQERTTP